MVTLDDQTSTREHAEAEGTLGKRYRCERPRFGWSRAVWMLAPSLWSSRRELKTLVRLVQGIENANPRSMAEASRRLKCTQSSSRHGFWLHAGRAGALSCQFELFPLVSRRHDRSIDHVGLTSCRTTLYWPRTGRLTWRCESLTRSGGRVSDSAPFEFAMTCQRQPN